jgi:ABC-type uncharacterized transport system auxiliary subunit
MGIQSVRKLRRRYSAATMLIAILGLGSCTIVPPAANNMIPSIGQAVEARPATKTLLVVAATDKGQGVTMPSEQGLLRWSLGSAEPAERAKITESIFRDALMNTLAHSGEFKTVGTAGVQDYRLDGSLYAQQVAIAGFNATATIGVRYKLVETSSQKQVWGDSVVSQCAFSGTESEGNECAMRKNLAVLVERLGRLQL